MTQLETIDDPSQIPILDAPARSSRLEELFLKDDFLQTVLIGFAGGFGLSTLVILFSLELTTLRAPIADQLGGWWFMVPTSTAIGFALWTVMLLRVRRHRITRMLRATAAKRQGDSGSDSDPAGCTNLGALDSNEDWL